MERKASVGRLSNLSGASSGAASTHKPTAQKLSRLSQLNEQNAKEQQHSPPQQAAQGKGGERKQNQQNVQKPTNHKPQDSNTPNRLPTSATLTEGGTTTTTRRSTLTSSQNPSSNTRLDQRGSPSNQGNPVNAHPPRSQKQPYAAATNQHSMRSNNTNKQIYSSITSTGDLVGSHNPSHHDPNNDSTATPIDTLLNPSTLSVEGPRPHHPDHHPRHNVSMATTASMHSTFATPQGYYGEGTNSPPSQQQSCSASMLPTSGNYTTASGTPPYLMAPMMNSNPPALVAVVTQASTSAPTTDPYSVRYHGADVEDNDRIPDYKVFHDSDRDVSMRGPSARSQAIYFHQQQQKAKSSPPAPTKATSGLAPSPLPLSVSNEGAASLGGHPISGSPGSAGGPSSLLLRQATSSFTGPNPNASASQNPIYLKAGSRPSNLNLNPSSFCDTSYTATPHSVVYSHSMVPGTPFTGGALPSPLLGCKQYTTKQTSALSTHTAQYPFNDSDTPTKRHGSMNDMSNYRSMPPHHFAFSSNNNTATHLLSTDENSGRVHSTSTAAPPLFRGSSHDLQGRGASAASGHYESPNDEHLPPMSREATQADIQDDEDLGPHISVGQDGLITTSATPASPSPPDVHHQATLSNNLKQPNNYFMFGNSSFAHPSEQGATNTDVHSQQASSYCFNTNRSEHNRSRPTWMDSNTTNNNRSASNIGIPPHPDGSLQSNSQTTSPVAISARRSSRIAISAQRSEADDYYEDEEEYTDDEEEYRSSRGHNDNSSRNRNSKPRPTNEPPQDGEGPGGSEEYFEGAEYDDEDEDCYYNNFGGEGAGEYQGRSFGRPGEVDERGAYDDDSDGESLLNGPIPSQEVLMGIMAQQLGGTTVSNSGAVGRVPSYGSGGGLMSSGRPISPGLGGQGLPSQYLVPSHLRGPSVASNGVLIIPSYDQQVPGHHRSFSGQHFSSHATSMAASKNASFNGVYAAQNFNYQQQLQQQQHSPATTTSPPVSLRFLNTLQEAVVGGANANDVLTILMFPGPGKEQSMFVTVSENETLGDLATRLADNYVKLDQNPFSRPTAAQLADLKSRLRFLTDKHELQPSIVAKDLIAQNQRRIVLSALPAHIVLPNLSSPSEDGSNGNAEMLPDDGRSDGQSAETSIQNLPSSGRLIPSGRALCDDYYHREGSSSARFHHQPLTVSQQSIRDFLQGSELGSPDDDLDDIAEDIEY